MFLNAHICGGVPERSEFARFTCINPPLSASSSCQIPETRLTRCCLDEFLGNMHHPSKTIAILDNTSNNPLSTLDGLRRLGNHLLFSTSFGGLKPTESKTDSYGECPPFGSVWYVSNGRRTKPSRFPFGWFLVQRRSSSHWSGPGLDSHLTTEARSVGTS